MPEIGASVERCRRGREMKRELSLYGRTNNRIFVLMHKDKQRRFFTIGPAALPESHKRIYRVAWRFIAAGMLIMLLLNVLIRL